MLRLANNYLSDVVNVTSDIGLGYVTVQIPTISKDNALLIVFARSSFDDRMTSYSIYNFANSTQETTPSNNILTLSPLDNTLGLSTNFTSLNIQGGILFSFGHEQNLDYMQGSTQCQIPNLIDKSPSIIIISGTNGSTYFQEWTAYPQVPLKSGSSFANSEQNIFSYIVTINGVLYKLNISLGDVPQ